MAHGHSDLDNKNHDGRFTLRDQLQILHYILKQSTEVNTIESSSIINGHSSSFNNQEVKSNIWVDRKKKLMNDFLQFADQNYSSHRGKNAAITALQNQLNELYSATVNHKKTYARMEYLFNYFQKFIKTIDYYKQLIYDQKTQQVKSEFNLMSGFEADAYKFYAYTLNGKKILQTINEEYHLCVVSAIENYIIHTKWSMNLFQNKKEIIIDEDKVTKIVPYKIGLIWDVLKKAENHEITSHQATSCIYRIADDASHQFRYFSKNQKKYRALQEIISTPNIDRTSWIKC